VDEPVFLVLPPRTPLVVGLDDTDLNRPLTVEGRAALEPGRRRVER
jgi:hypothetical protein